MICGESPTQEWVLPGFPKHQHTSYGTPAKSDRKKR